MHLVKIASIWAAILLLCLPAPASEPDSKQRSVGGTPGITLPGPAIALPAEVQNPGYGPPLPQEPSEPTMHAMPPHDFPPPPSLGPPVLPTPVVAGVLVCVPSYVPCSPGPMAMCYSACPQPPAPVMYPPIIPPSQGVPIGAAAHPGNLIAEGIEWVQRREYEIAIRSLDEALRLEHKNVLAYYCRGEAWYRKGVAQGGNGTGDESFERAANDYSVAIFLAPDFDEAYSCLADAYLQLRRYDLAIQNQNEALRRYALRHPSLARQIKTQMGQSGYQSAPAAHADATQIRAYRGRAAAHAALAKLYAIRNDQEAMRQELKTAAADFNRASQIRVSSREVSPIATHSLEAEPQSAH
jgi:hypothetical protein